MKLFKDMNPAERAAVREARQAAQAAEDNAARAYATANPVTPEERKSLPQIGFDF